jgi:hypothetical protein
VIESVAHQRIPLRGHDAMNRYAANVIASSLIPPPFESRDSLVERGRHHADTENIAALLRRN